MVLTNKYFFVDGKSISEELIQKFDLRNNSRNLRFSHTENGDVLNFCELMGLILLSSAVAIQSLPMIAGAEKTVRLSVVRANIGLTGFAHRHSKACLLQIR